jgi:ATP-dependent RNA helicase DeaD
VQNRAVTEDEPQHDTTTFASLGLPETLLRTLTTLGYEVPTPIQERTIPVLLTGRDLIGQAQTGTGKTAAFALPILAKIDAASRDTQALVLAPTRELAVQVAEAFHSYAKELTEVSVLPVYGGASIVHQLKRLERGVQIVVGTPGRLIDHLDRKSLRLDKLRFVVLDEADEMLKMGFIEDVERILAAAPDSRQVALFSATMPPEVVRIAERHMAKAVRIEIEHKAVNTPAIEQRFLNVSEGQKLDALTQILELEESDATLVFRRTKNGAAELAERLEGRGFAAAAMHGDMKQQERESVIRRLKGGQIEVVVATDVAARGLDVEQITHVVNYDMPHDVEVYVHRIGRTGRAGRSGMATLFVTPRERRMMREIERFTNMPIKAMKMPTRADVAARRVAQLKDTLRKTIQEGDLDLYVALVEQLAEEGQHDITEIAAAAARLASSGKPLEVEPEPPARAAFSPRPESSHDASAPRAASSAPGERRPRGEGTVRLTMAVGKRDGIRPADVVGSIANEADIPGRDIGPIDIREDVTFVSVPAEVVDHVIESVGKAKFRGRSVNLRVARENEGGDRPPRPSGPSFKRPGGPPRSGPPRTGGFERERPPFKRDDRPPRAGAGAGPRYGAGARPSAPRDGAPPRDRKPFRRDDAPSGGAFKKFAKGKKPRG